MFSDWAIRREPGAVRLRGHRAVCAATWATKPDRKNRLPSLRERARTSRVRTGSRCLDVDRTHRLPRERNSHHLNGALSCVPNDQMMPLPKYSPLTLQQPDWDREIKRACELGPMHSKKSLQLQGSRWGRQTVEWEQFASGDLNCNQRRLGMPPRCYGWDWKVECSANPRRRCKCSFRRVERKWNPAFLQEAKTKNALYWREMELDKCNKQINCDWRIKCSETHVVTV